MHRFFVENHLQIGAEIVLPLEKSRQISNVLRLRAGDTITLFNGDGNDYAAQLTAPPGAGQATITEIRAARTTGRPEIELVQALIKSDKFDWVVQKATELGVVRIQPLETANTVVSLPVDRAQLRLDRWRRIAIEAAEQSGRATVPTIMPVVTFEQMLCQDAIRGSVMLWERETAQGLDRVIRTDPPWLMLIVGPEGGFTPGEVESYRAAGGRVVGLGALILRSETAALAGLAAIRALAASRCCKNSVDREHEQ